MPPMLPKLPDPHSRHSRHAPPPSGVSFPLRLIEVTLHPEKFL